MAFLTVYIRQRKRVIIGFFLCALVFLAAFALYRLPVAAVIYPALLCMVLLAMAAAFDIRRTWRKHQRLTELQKLSAALMEDFPEAETVAEQDYQQLISFLRQELNQLSGANAAKYADMVEYYTIWVHQIKTPIAAMRLTLQNEDTDRARRLSEELQRIEQYVEMVLTYFRLESQSTDYVIGEYALDDIVKTAVRRFAPQFIRRKLRLVYEPLNVTVLTDEKWLCFVIEQLLSNALKYTPSGTVTISLEATMTLCIRDTGIGIAPEDLPRIFEMGYTGFNGRSDKKASGIGLYLCKRICMNLGHSLSAESVIGQGTVMRLGLERKKLKFE